MATAHTRKQILDAAEKLFLRHGPDDASMREITQAAGVGLAAVNYHFGSKDNLLADVAQRITTQLWADQEKALSKLRESDQTPTMEEIINGFIVPYQKTIGRRDGRGRLRLVAQILGGPPSRAREQLTEALQPLQSLLLELVHQAQPDLTDEEVRFRLESMVAVVLFALQGGFDERILGADLRLPESDSPFVNYLAQILAAPALDPAVANA